MHKYIVYYCSDCGLAEEDFWQFDKTSYSRYTFKNTYFGCAADLQLSSEFYVTWHEILNIQILAGDINTSCTWEFLNMLPWILRAWLSKKKKKQSRKIAFPDVHYV